MSYIDENVFSDQMRGLLVARGGYTSEKKKEEIKRYWYIEFRDCDEQAFVQVMGKLKFGGKSGEGFPSFRDFREQYNILIKPADRLKGRQFCGSCDMGRVFFRGLHKESGEVHDYAADCSQCIKNSENKVNPRDLHKDRSGQLRTLDALACDRKPQPIKWPQFVMEGMARRNDGEKPATQYFLGLRPEHDPDVELEYVAPTPANGKDIARALLGPSNPKKEAKRAASIRKSEFSEENMDKFMSTLNNPEHFESGAPEFPEVPY